MRILTREREDWRAGRFMAFVCFSLWAAMVLTIALVFLPFGVCDWILKKLRGPKGGSAPKTGGNDL
jgi:nitrate reductase NapE component